MVFYDFIGCGAVLSIRLVVACGYQLVVSYEGCGICTYCGVGTN